VVNRSFVLAFAVGRVGSLPSKAHGLVSQGIPEICRHFVKRGRLGGFPYAAKRIPCTLRLTVLMSTTNVASRSLHFGNLHDTALTYQSRNFT